MSYPVAVTWSPPHELLLSLMAVTSAQTHKVLDLGPAWVKEVRQQLPPEFDQQVRALMDEVPFPSAVVEASPVKGDVPGFLDWVRRLTPEEIFRLVVSLGGTPPPMDALGPLRDRWVEMLAVWHERYFRRIDPRILSGLQAEADRWQTRLASMAPEAVVAEATNGLCIEETAGVERVLLVPQYHHRPLNITTWNSNSVIIAYPADALPPAEGAMPAGLRRLLRALDDDSRLAMLKALSGRPLSFSEVAERSGLAKSTVHHHLVTLRAAGLVWCHISQSPNNTYSLRPDALDRLSPELRLYLKGE